MYGNDAKQATAQHQGYISGSADNRAPVPDRSPDAVREKLTQILYGINNSHSHSDDICAKLWGSSPAVMEPQGNKSLSDPPVITLLDAVLSRVNDLQQKLQSVSVSL